MTITKKVKASLKSALGFWGILTNVHKIMHTSPKWVRKRVGVSLSQAQAYKMTGALFLIPH